MAVTVYQQIKAITSKVTEQYLTDITVHDHAFCRALQTGHAAFWTARPCGSHWVWLEAPGDDLTAATLFAMRQRLDLFDAVDRIWPDGPWYLLESTNGPYGNVTPCTTEQARSRLVARLHALAQALAPQAA